MLFLLLGIPPVPVLALILLVWGSKLAESTLVLVRLS